MLIHTRSIRATRALAYDNTRQGNNECQDRIYYFMIFNDVRFVTAPPGLGN